MRQQFLPMNPSPAASAQASALPTPELNRNLTTDVAADQLNDRLAAEVPPI